MHPHLVQMLKTLRQTVGTPRIPRRRVLPFGSGSRPDGAVGHHRRSRRQRILRQRGLHLPRHREKSDAILTLSHMAYVRGVKLILFKGPHTARFDLKWARPVKP